MKAHRDAITLSDVCELIVDCEHNTAPTQEHGFPLIRTPNIGRGRLILDGVQRVSEATFEAWTRRAVPQEGDLILAREAPVGNVAIVPAGINVCLGQRTVLIRPDAERIDGRYLAYLLLGDEIQGLFQSLANGATVHHLNLGDIRRLVLPRIPSRTDQVKIATILSAYDDLIENNLRRIAILEEMARALYREWFVEFRYPGHEKDSLSVDSPLGRVPGKWCVSRLGDECRIIMGQSPPSTSYNTVGDGLPFHQGVSDFGALFPSTTRYCTACERVAEKDDILMSVRAPVGRINLADQSMVIGRGLCAIRNRSAYQAFTLFQLKHFFREEDVIGNGAIFKAVRRDDVEGVPFLRPPELMVRSSDRLAQSIVDQMRTLTLINSNLQLARDTLLPRLISGELDVSNITIDAEEDNL